MTISYEPLRGFKDYLPPDSEILTWICNTFADVVKRFGYREVRTPVVENFQLFALKSGEEIRESMFVFSDKAGREVALRPEITPSVVRLYLKEMRHWPKPIRLYYVGVVFRYDEPQFGRYREFTQAGVEILGGEGVHYDVELIEILENFYDAIELKDRSYKVNNVAIFRELAKGAGMADADLDRLLHYLDKGMYSKAVELFVSRGSYAEAKVVEELANIKQNKGDGLSAMIDVLSKLSYADRVLSHVQTLERYVEMAKAIGAKVVVEPSFARGIAYYTDIIFEVVVPWLNISIAGGGRYDNLTQVYGGESLPTTGFAIGVERTMLALLSSRKGDQVLKAQAPRALFLLMLDDVQLYKRFYEVVKDLRNRGVYVQLEISPAAKLAKWLEYSSKYSIDYVIIIGKKEVERNVVVVRDMKKWTQKEVGVEELHKVFTEASSL